MRYLILGVSLLLSVLVELSKAKVDTFVSRRRSNPAETCAANHDIPCLPAQMITSQCRPEFCREVPTAMTFVYTGGDCKHSYNLQKKSQFLCHDHDAGPPPTNVGERSYIKVTDASQDGNIVYHAGWVQVGETFTLFDDGHDFQNTLVMTIYDHSMTLMQEIIFEASCIYGNMFLCDRYGAAEVCAISNSAQGDLSSCPKDFV